MLEELEELEHRARRRDILAGDEVIFGFYDARIPADVVSVAHFDRWWKARAAPIRGLLRLPARPARQRATRRTCSTRARGPDAWRQGELSWR